jgi:signal transduction histidine kinase
MTTSPVLMPHAVCWAADPKLVWTMVVANFITFVSYATLCGALLYIARRTSRVIARDWAWFVVGFALFIVACGSTHLMDVVTTWIPVFWVGAWATIITAILSAYVALMLIRRAASISFAINDYAGRLEGSEQEKQSMRDKLLAARKMEDWSRMSAAISHEISNPLEAIQNILYLLETDEDVPAENIELARQAREEVGRVITISQSTLAYHRESAMPEMVDLHSVAQSVSFLLQGVIEKQRVEFRIVAEDLDTIEAFPGETRQVILNLARNACEAIAEPGGLVTLELRNAEGGVELRVTDEGPGIDAKILPKLFEFGKSSKGEQGNGMGLWTVKQIVLKHKGRIELDREYRGGSRFIVWWPRYQESEAGQHGSPVGPGLLPA